MTREKSIRKQTRAGLKFSVSRVRTHLRKNLPGVRIADEVDVSITGAIEEVMNAFMEACLSKMSEKDIAKGIVRVKHCADALADPTTSFSGFLPRKVAGVYRKQVRTHQKPDDE